MFKRFTKPARTAVVIAQEEARSLRQDTIHTAHLLLGLLHDADTVAAEVLADCDVTATRARALAADGRLDAGALASLGIDLAAVRRNAEQTFGPGALDWPGGRVLGGHIPFSTRSKKALELALREALRLGHDYIGTEHMLLGLLRAGDGSATQLLTALDTDPETVRAAVLARLQRSA